MTTKAINQELSLYLRQIDYELLTVAQERELGWRIIHHNDPKAREQLACCNLRLVVHIAKRFKYRGLLLTDLIAEGNVGLLRAVETYDPDQGVRFSTHAAWWIKQRIKRALISAGQPMHVPAYMADRIVKWKVAKRELEKSLGREPSNSELSESMRLPPGKMRTLRNAVRTLQQPKHTSTNAVENSPMLVQTLPDHRTSTPEDLAINNDNVQLVRKLLGLLNPQEARVIRMRFGLDGTTPMTLKEIGMKLGLTRQRIGQIEIEALSNLKDRLASNNPLSEQCTSNHGSYPIRSSATPVISFCTEMDEDSQLPTPLDDLSCGLVDDDGKPEFASRMDYAGVLSG